LIFGDFDESDEYCPHYDNHFVISLKEEQEKIVITVEGTTINMNKDEWINSDIFR
jgi:hypothetical protein